MIRLKIDKEANATLRWVQKAINRRGIPRLAGIRFEDAALIATDGSRIHAAKEPAFEAIKGSLAEGHQYQGKVAPGARIVELERVDGIFPEYRDILPGNPAESEVELDPKFLREAIAGMVGGVKIKLRGKLNAVELFGKDAAGNDRYVLVMPRYLSENLKWRPEGK